MTGPVVIVRVAPPFDEEAWNEAQRVAAYYAVVGEERERAEKAERERDIGKAFLAVEVACHEVASREAMDARSQLALAMHWGRELVDHHEEHHAKELRWQARHREVVVERDEARAHRDALAAERDAALRAGAEAGARLHLADDLVERAVRNAGRRSKLAPRWVHMKNTFAVGSARAAELCRRFRLDPDEGIGDDRG